MKKIIYLAHPVGGDVAGNLVSVQKWFLWIVRNFDVAVCVPWYMYVLLLDDSNPDERRRGMHDNLIVLTRCDEVWLGAPSSSSLISPGMRGELDVGFQHGLRAKNLIRYAPWVERGEFPADGIVLESMEIQPK